MSFIELYNRADAAVAMLNDYESGELAALLEAWENGDLEPQDPPPAPSPDPEPDPQDPPPDPGSGDGGYGNGEYGNGEYGNGGTIPDEHLERLTEIIERADRAVSGVEFPPRRIGPSPVGDYHTADGWGIHFSTNRELHFGNATVDSRDPGTITATLAEYDGGHQFDPIERREIDVEAGVQRVTLDMSIPAAGEYILVREDDHPLRRGRWDGWELASRDGLLMHGGSKAGEYTKPNDYWYYFFNLSVAISEDAHLPEPAPTTPTTTIP